MHNFAKCGALIKKIYFKMTIINYSKKFIFVKTNKTAGTSLEIALSQFCGADDVIGQIMKEDENLRRKLGFRTSKN